MPSLHPSRKLKLTAVEGARIRRISLGLFTAGKRSETCLMTLTNLGECIVLSIPYLSRQDTAAVIKREDIKYVNQISFILEKRKSKYVIKDVIFCSGISSFTFTKYGEGLYLHSSSEIQRITLSASRKTIPQCSLMLTNRKQLQPESPLTPEKQNRSHNIITNGIPEEDEEEEEEDNENSLTKKG